MYRYSVSTVTLAAIYRLRLRLRFFLAPKYMTNCSYKHTFSPPHLIYLLNPTSSQHILTSSYH